MLTPGSSLPTGTVYDERGEAVLLKDFIDSYIVLYVYPKDNTPGCTAEACSFRDQSKDIVNVGAIILGISPDSVNSHKKFKEKFELNFTLLSDPERVIIEQLGAWGEKTSYGKTTVGILRSTFVFGKDGTLLKVWPKVSPATHGEEIATYLRELNA